MSADIRVEVSRVNYHGDHIVFWDEKSDNQDITWRPDKNEAECITKALELHYFFAAALALDFMTGQTGESCYLDIPGITEEDVKSWATLLSEYASKFTMEVKSGTNKYLVVYGS